jgi:hypothetical protein
MKITLALITLIVSTFAQAAHAQLREPDIRVIGAGASSGGAQDSIGSGVGKRARPAILNADPTMAKDDLVRLFMVDYARCIYDLDRRSVDKMLDQVPGTDDYAKAAQRAAVNQCLSTGDMRFQQSSLQGAVFIHKYRLAFGRAAPTLREAPFDYAALAASAPDEWKGRYLAYRRFGECVVRRDPVAARAMVMGPIGSAGEAGAIQTLGPSFSACIDAGVNANFTKDRLSGVVAEVLYRLSVPVEAGK